MSGCEGGEVMGGEVRGGEVRVREGGDWEVEGVVLRCRF